MPREATMVTVTVLILVLFGMLMVYSVCAVHGEVQFRGTPLKHALYMALGAAVMFIASRFDYHRFRDPLVFRWIVLTSLVLLVLVLVPGIGKEVNGAQRWIQVGPLNFQPSELAKFALVLLLAVKLTDNEEHVHTFRRGFLPPLIIAGVFAFLVLLEKDLGVPAVMMGVSFILFCIAGVRWRYLIGSLAPVGAGLWLLIQMEPHRVKRLMYFLDPWPYRDVVGGSYQLIQSLAGFAQGGLWGRGAGASSQKLGYLPEAHNDFIFAPLGEEFGLFGTLAVVVLFAVLCFAVLRISMYAADRFGSLLAAGVGMLILLQGAVVMMVTTGIAPTKGLPLPYISYGGTALVVFMGLAGILVNVAAQAPDIEKQLRTEAATA